MSIKTSTASGHPLATGPFGGNSSGRQGRHGTHYGYMAHRNAGEPACGPCGQAHSDFSRAASYRARLGYTLTMAEAYARLGLPADRTELCRAGGDA